MLAVAYGPDAPWNESHFKEPAFCRIAAAARRAGRAQAQGNDLGNAAILHDDGATIVPRSATGWMRTARRSAAHAHGGFDMDNGMIADKLVEAETTAVRQ